MSVRALTALLAAVVLAGLLGCAQGRTGEAALPHRSYTNPAFEGGADRITVPVGTEIHLTLSAPVGPATSQVGDQLTGTTTAAVVVGGRLALPAGSTVYGRVTGVDPATQELDVSEKGGAVALLFTRVTTPRGDSASMSGSLSSLAHSKDGSGLAIRLGEPLTIARRW